MSRWGGMRGFESSSSMVTGEAAASRGTSMRRLHGSACSCQTVSVPRPGGTSRRRKRPPAVGAGVEGRVDHQHVAHHVVVDVAEHPHHALLARSARAFDLAPAVEPEVEAGRLGDREDVVEDRVPVGERRRWPPSGTTSTRGLERLALGDHLGRAAGAVARGHRTVGLEVDDRQARLRRARPPLDRHRRPGRPGRPRPPAPPARGESAATRARSCGSGDGFIGDSRMLLRGRGRNGLRAGSEEPAQRGQQLVVLPLAAGGVEPCCAAYSRVRSVPGTIPSRTPKSIFSQSQLPLGTG